MISRVLRWRWPVALGLCFAAAAPLPVLSAPAANPSQGYQAALSLYQYNKTQPLDAKIIETVDYAESRMIRFSYASANTQRVPALLFMPKSATKDHPVPCLLMLHGLGSNKETMEPLARYAATLGYASLAIDEYGQGQRAPTPTMDPLSPAVVQQELLTGIPQTVIDARRGLDYLETRPEIDSKRLGLVGVSLGAIMGCVASGVDTRLKATVLVSGGGDWSLILQHLAAQTRSVGGQSLSAPQNINWPFISVLLMPEDPLTFASHIAPRRLLMVNGRKDTTIIPAAAEELYKAASAPANSHAQIVWLADAGHIPSPQQVYPVVQKWLAKNL